MPRPKSPLDGSSLGQDRHAFGQVLWAFIREIVDDQYRVEVNWPVPPARGEPDTRPYGDNTVHILLMERPEVELVTGQAFYSSKQADWRELRRYPTYCSVTIQAMLYDIEEARQLDRT